MNNKASIGAIADFSEKVNPTCLVAKAASLNSHNPRGAAVSSYSKKSIREDPRSGWPSPEV
uniref:Uncharacterized protein n=1 Tax=Anguilla anguilla TaxID=7936 RepID=A0A0E9TWB5_ANGAN